MHKTVPECGILIFVLVITWQQQEHDVTNWHWWPLIKTDVCKPIIDIAWSWMSNFKGQWLNVKTIEADDSQ